jgi:hypothetical protein
MKWKRLIIEAKTPSDMKSINASFNKDVSDEKFTPTVKFMKAVYNKMNKEFFFNYLPDEPEFKLVVRSMGNNRDVGIAYYKRSIGGKKNIVPVSMLLNSSYTLTLHGWMEVILHEMIHISDYMSHPEHYYDKDYNPHGDWFMGHSRKFQKIGFDVKQYCDLDFDINKEDEEMETLETPNTFAVYEENFKGKQRYWILRINGYDREKLMKYLRENEIDKAFIITTKNPLSSEIPIWNCEKEPVTDEFNKAFVQYYGPFKRKELLAPMDVVSESDDELDRYMRIAREIEGVVSVERIGNEVVVGIS